MSTQIPIAFVDAYKANVVMGFQQKISKLRAACRMESFTGSDMFVEKLGPKDAQLRGARHGETPISDSDHTRRKLTMADYVVPADLIDTDDRLKLLAEFQSSYVQNQVFSLHRQIDDCVITALGGSSYGGHTGATTIRNYDVGECRLVGSSGVIVAAGSDHTDLVETGLTIAKLLTCKELLDNAEVDDERQRYFLTNPHNINQLLNTTEVKSSDYNTVKALAQGQIDSYLGFKFIKSTRLPADGTDTGATNCYAFAQDAIVLAIAEEPTVNVDRLPTRMNSVQVYSTLSIGATRVEGEAVTEINLDTA